MVISNKNQLNQKKERGINWEKIEGILQNNKDLKRARIHLRFRNTWYQEYDNIKTALFDIGFTWVSAIIFPLPIDAISPDITETKAYFKL